MIPDAVEFAIGDTVYHRMDPSLPGLVTGIIFRPGCHSYLVTFSRTETGHFPMELSREKSFFEVESGTPEVK